MMLAYLLIFFGLGVLLGYIIHYNQTPKCNHKWNLIENGNIRWEGKLTGFYKVYECEHCKKMRTEKAEIL